MISKRRGSCELHRQLKGVIPLFILVQRTFILAAIRDNLQLVTLVNLSAVCNLSTGLN